MVLEAVNECSKLMAKQKLSIAFAESATAGRLASEFALSSESGKVLRGGIICYDACIKEEILKVPHRLIKKYTPESAEVTEELAKRLKKFMKADIHVAITGLTTSGGSETPEKPVGTMFIHLLVKNKSIGIREVFKGSDEDIMVKAIEQTARLITNEIRDLNPD
jgi:nicotinamide-nucleotide amidase